MIDLIARAAECDPNNIFCGVKPNFDWLGPEFRSIAVLALGGVLGLALLALAFFLIKAIVGLRHAMSTKKPQEAEHARNVILGTSIAIVAIVLVPIIYGALLTIGNS
ncbi:hypothetical protein [Agreia sp. COWG]|uniref:hypothetical protein n=1 Tax=Agreia sp. COWG TaxID=2773266 RepID=UPI001926923F|nr:hypothetical protein [Agreia sp. COWG]CAD6016051.1 conserved protein of unknown function [Agreia sp. COWG]